MSTTPSYAEEADSLSQTYGPNSRELDKGIRAIFYRCRLEWHDVAEYIALPQALMEHIAEVYTDAPDFVRSQPRWSEIVRDPSWDAAVKDAATRDRRVALSIYRTARWVAERDVKAIVNQLNPSFESGGRISLVNSPIKLMLSLGDATIDLRLARLLTDPEWLLHLSKSRFSKVRLEVAKNEHTPAGVLRALCADSAESVANAAAAHPSCPDAALDGYGERLEERFAARLDRLTTLAWTELREFLTHPDFPAHGVERLAACDPWRHFVCAAHPNAPEHVWRRQLEAKEVWRRAAVALNPCAPVEVLRELMTLDDHDIAFALASNPALPEDLQLALARSPDRAIRRHLADRTTYASVWRAVAAQAAPGDAKSRTLEELLAIAIDPKTTGKQLIALRSVLYRARSHGGALATSISHAIASHPNLPPKLIGEYREYTPWLLRQNRSSVLMRLEGVNESDGMGYSEWKLSARSLFQLPGHVPNAMLRGSDLQLHRLACTHDWCDKALLFPLWYSGDKNVLMKLAKREDMPRFFYEVLWAQCGVSVVEALTENARFKALRGDGSMPPVHRVPATSAKRGGMPTNKKEREVLARMTSNEAEMLTLAEDKVADVRMSLARNPELSLAAIEKLARDPSDAVRCEVIAQLGRFSPAQTHGIEHAMCALGGQSVAALGRTTRHGDLQIALIGIDPSMVQANPKLSPEALELYARRASISSVLQIACDADHGRDFTVRVACMVQEIVDHGREDALAGYAYFGAPDDESAKESYQSRVREFSQLGPTRGPRPSTRAMQDAYGDAIRHVMEKYPDDDRIQRVMLAWLMARRADEDNRIWAAERCRIITPEDFEVLSVEPFLVRRGLARNPSLPPSIVERFKVDDDQFVRAGLASWCEDASSGFIEDASAHVRAALARNTRVDAIQRRLLDDEDSDVVDALMTNGCLARDVVHEALSPTRDARMKRSLLSKCPLDTLEALTTSGDAWVRENAMTALKRRRPVPPARP